jgi:hypothetical protein
MNIVAQIERRRTEGKKQGKDEGKEDNIIHIK